MIYTTIDNFYLSDEQLDDSPSRKDGIDRDTENNLRMYGCELIQEAGILLGFVQAVMATGQVLFHRFYCKRSMKAYNVKKVAATALWQGAKLEEVRDVSRHPRELLNKIMVVIDRCTARRDTPEGRKIPVLDLHSKEADEFRRSLIRYELEMLKAFGFITHVDHPHKLMINYSWFLGLRADLPPDIGVSNFMQEAWNIANDSLRTTLCVRHKSSVVACGIIYYTARRLDVALPEDDPPWWELFEVELHQIVDVCRVLHELYRAPKPEFIPVCHQLLPSKPPTPVTSAAQAGATDDGTTPLPDRPMAKPLDPSVRLPDASVAPNGNTGPEELVAGQVGA
eukprot:GHRR01010640.1.p1 GENE.GHRR01010640.1~~GHRR01010640.1.p1  ORF type:complete len:338 (+),score=87.45 GHRR01010640.1:153-1166(+)